MKKHIGVSLIVALIAEILSVCLSGCGVSIKTPGSTIVVAPPDFSLQLTPASLTMNYGTAQPISVTATALNGFSGPVQIALSGLPIGVNASSTNLTLLPGVTQTVNLTAGSTAVDGTATLTLMATSGALSHSTSFAITIATSLVTRGLMAFFPANEGSGTILSSTVGGYEASLGGSGNAWSPVGVVLNGSGYVSLPDALNSALTAQIYVSQPDNPNPYVGFPELLEGNGGTTNTQWVEYTVPTTPCCPGFQPGLFTVVGAGIGAGSDTPFAGQNTLSLVMGLQSNSTYDTFYIGPQQVVMGGWVTSAAGGYQVGGNYLVGVRLQGTVGPSAYYSVQLTPGEIAQNAGYFNKLMLSRGIPQPSNANVESVNQFVAIGDSITYGWDGPNTYCHYVVPNNPYGIECLGQPGQVTAFGVTEAPQMALWAATNAKRNIFFNDYMTNDARFSISPSISLANLAESCREIKQVYPNATVLVGTMLSLGGLDSAKDTVNPLIRQMATNGQSGCDGFIDMASDPILGADGNISSGIWSKDCAGGN